MLSSVEVETRDRHSGQTTSMVLTYDDASGLSPGLAFFGRPAVFLAVLIGLGTGWALIEHWDPAGPGVVGGALVLATVLGAPWPRRDRIRRAWRARRHGRGGKRGHDAVFR